MKEVDTAQVIQARGQDKDQVQMRLDQIQQVMKKMEMKTKVKVEWDQAQVPR